MQMTYQEVLHEARQLPLEDQRWLIKMLLLAEGLNSREEIDAAWAVEIARRAAEADSELELTRPSAEAGTPEKISALPVPGQLSAAPAPSSPAESPQV